jgi:hypothetical protein
MDSRSCYITPFQFLGAELRNRFGIERLKPWIKADVQKVQERVRSHAELAQKPFYYQIRCLVFCETAAQQSFELF